MYYKRTLILNDINAKTSTKKGVITLENIENKIKGNLRLYNFDLLPQKAAIGISSGEEVIKVPLNNIDNFLEFDISQGFDLQEKISCALVDISELTNPKIIIGGTSNYLNDWADIVEQSFFESPKQLSREDIYDNNTAEIEKEISTVLREDQDYHDCDRCKECKYKKAFFDKIEKQDSSTNEVSEISQESENICKIKEILATATLSVDNQTDSSEMIDNKVPIEPNEDNKPTNDIEYKDTFYYQIKDQIDDLFAKHSREESLEALIPESKWVKVEYEDVEGHYVIGLIYDGDKLLFISYGLPAKGPNNPPPDLIDYAQWLPLTEDNNGEGYWLVYQNATNGESIKIE